MKRILLAFFLMLLIHPLFTYGQGLEVNGTIVAFELSYGHGYDVYKTEEVPRKYLVIRIDKLIKGNETSKYILAAFAWNKGEVDFYDNNQWKFKLSKNSKCDSTLKELQFVFLGSKNISGIQPRLLKTLGNENEMLPLDSKLSCYNTNLEKMQKSNSLIPVSNGVEKETYVLEDSLWINPPQSPLKVFFGGIDEFTNTTNKTISEFNLGCVSNQNNKIQVMKTFEVKKDKISPNKTIFAVNNASLAPSMDKLYICYQMKAKLTTVSVRFEDNSVWEFK